MKTISIHEKYAIRPEKLKGVCLAQFATSYVSAQKPKNVQFEDYISTTNGSIKSSLDSAFPFFGCINNYQ